MEGLTVAQAIWGVGASGFAILIAMVVAVYFRQGGVEKSLESLGKGIERLDAKDKELRQEFQAGLRETREDLRTEIRQTREDLRQEPRAEIQRDGEITRAEIRRVLEAVASHEHDADGGIIFRVPPYTITPKHDNPKGPAVMRTPL